ncbi:MAG: TlpA disulfide reductase family protein [Actinomycetota bacterium]
MPESPLDAANRELAEVSPPWYRSPLVLLGAVVVIAAVIAFIVAGGGDDDTAADAGFGGADIPEVDSVAVEGAALPVYELPVNDAAVGLDAPVVTATSLADGSSVELGPGTPRIIGFFAHWCPHCQAELPELVDWLAANPLPGDVEFVAVSTAVDEGRGNYPPSAWFNDEAWPGSVVVDDGADLLAVYGFQSFPAFIAIDADGVVIDRLGGNVGPVGFKRLADALG